jgi:hypothetical protein
VGVEHCAECEFTYGLVGPDDLASALRTIARRYRAALFTDRAVERSVRSRPSAGVWSALEYGCHYRDVLLAQRERVLLALVEECPTFAPIYRDQRVELARYSSEDVGTVVGEIEMAADLIAWVFDGLSSVQLARPCIYNYPEPTERTVEWMGDHALHEGAHHLRDIEQGLRG